MVRPLSPDNLLNEIVIWLGRPKLRTWRAYPLNRVREVSLIQKSLIWGTSGARLDICVDTVIPREKEEAVWAREGEHVYFEYIDDPEPVKDIVERTKKESR